MFPGSVVKTQDHSSKVVADHCFICVLVSFIRRGWARPGAWGRYYGTRIGLALFLFPPFYLSCHYVSSAVFNDGSSLQAVSGCIAVGGGDMVAAGWLCFFSSFYVSLSSGDKKTSQSYASKSELYNSVKSTVVRCQNAVRRSILTWDRSVQKTIYMRLHISWEESRLEWPQRNVEFPQRHAGSPSPLAKLQYYPKKSIKSSPLVVPSGCFQWTRRGRTFSQCFRVSDVCVATSAPS